MFGSPLLWIGLGVLGLLALVTAILAFKAMQANKGAISGQGLFRQAMEESKERQKSGQRKDS